MKTAAALALTLFLSPAIADTLSVSLSNLTLDSASWSDIAGNLRASSSVPGQEPVSEIRPLDSLYGAHSLTVGGVTASKNADGTSFLVTADEAAPGTKYKGSIDLGTDFFGNRIMIAPFDTVTIYADFAGSITKSEPCDSDACGSGLFAYLKMYVNGPEIEFLLDNDGLFTLTSDSLARRLQLSYTNPTWEWLEATVDLELGVHGMVAGPIPEPSTYALLALGLGAIAVRSSRRSR